MASASMPSLNRRTFIPPNEDDQEEGLELVSNQRNHRGIEDTFIRERIRAWTKSDFKDEDLWEQFRHDFSDWKEVNFRLASLDALRELRTHLRLHGV